MCSKGGVCRCCCLLLLKAKGKEVAGVQCVKGKGKREEKVCRACKEKEGRQSRRKGEGWEGWEGQAWGGLVSEFQEPVPLLSEQI